MSLPIIFLARLTQFRKQHNVLTQQVLANAIVVHVNQIKRYETSTIWFTLETFVNIGKVLHVSLHMQALDENERGPYDDLRPQFEAVSHMPDHKHCIIRALLDAMIVNYQTSILVCNLSSDRRNPS